MVFDVRAAVAHADATDGKPATALRRVSDEIDEASTWAKREVARAIATEKRCDASWSPAQREEWYATVDRMKTALRVLTAKRDEVQRCIEIVSRRAGRTASPVLPATRVAVDASPPYVVSHRDDDFECLTVSGPPGGMDTLQVYRFPILDASHDGVVAAWARVDPKTHENAATARRGRVTLGQTERLALAYTQPYMSVRHYAVLWVELGATLIACRRIESGPDIPWKRFESCPLLGSVRLER